MDFGVNKIKVIDSCTFNGLTELVEISFRFNQIKVIDMCTHLMGWLI